MNRCVTESGSPVASSEATSVPRLALRPREAMKALGIGARHLWSMTNQGLIPHVKLGRAILYPVAALEAMLVEQAVKGVCR